MNTDQQDYFCPECGKALRQRQGKKGAFWGCSAYPECRVTFSDRNGAPDLEHKRVPNTSQHSARASAASVPAPKRKAAQGDYSCPQCGAALHQIRGKNGKFWGCSGYPDCRVTFPDQDGAPNLTFRRAQPDPKHPCPECGKPMIRRPSKYGRGYWWGCSAYPVCRYTARDVNGEPQGKGERRDA